MTKEKEAPAPVEPPPHRDSDGRLTRAGMEAVLARGESVLIRDKEGDRIVSKVEHLPDEADLVKGNADAEKMLADSLDAQIQALAAKRAQLGARAEAKEAGKEADPPHGKPEMPRSGEPSKAPPDKPRK